MESRYYTNSPTLNIIHTVVCPQTTIDFGVARSRLAPRNLDQQHQPTKIWRSFAELWNDKWIIFVHQTLNAVRRCVCIDVSIDLLIYTN